MDRQPANMHWLQNNNERPTRRPTDPTGRPTPNGQTTPPKRGSSLNRWLLILVAVMVAVYLYSYFNFNANTTAPARTELSYSDFYTQIDNKNIKSATLIGQVDIQGELNNPVGGHTTFHTAQLPNGDTELANRLIASGAKVSYQPPQDNSFWLNILITFLPWVALVGLFIFFSRRASQGQQGIFSFGKSRAKLILEDRPSTTFADVAGVDESKYELQEVVEFLKTPAKFHVACYS